MKLRKKILRYLFANTNRLVNETVLHRFFYKWAMTLLLPRKIDGGYNRGYWQVFINHDYKKYYYVHIEHSIYNIRVDLTYKCIWNAYDKCIWKI